MLYSASNASGATAAGAAIADLRSTASDVLSIREMQVFSFAATAAQIGLIRPNAIGTATSPLLGQPHDPAKPAGTGVLGTAWSAAPTIAASPIYIRRAVLPAAIGAGIIWVFGPGELIVPISSSLLLWNFGAAANPICQVNFTWDE